MVIINPPGGKYKCGAVSAVAGNGERETKKNVNSAEWKNGKVWSVIREDLALWF